MAPKCAFFRNLMTLLVDRNRPDGHLLYSSTLDSNASHCGNHLLQRELDFIESLIAAQFEVSQDRGQSTPITLNAWHCSFTIRRSYKLS